ncbi:MxaK protein [Methylophaga sp.]|uniref:MxaK protein n=1 Tax=Methylophaga sp. TaxID=2024840 RepID=UPI003F6A3A89
MNKFLLSARWLLNLLIILSAISLLVTSMMLWQKQQVDAYIADPTSFEEVPDAPEAQFTHAIQLERKGEHDLALDKWTQVLGIKDPELLPAAYYNRGNINLREALSMTASDGRQIPLVELAKQDYRSALAMRPEMWDARYNLEVALRMVSEDPANTEDFEKNVISSQRSIESKGFKVDLP